MTNHPPDTRRWEVEAALARIGDWASSRSDIRALVLVGSYARGEATGASDVDLVVLTTSPGRYVKHDDWVHAIGGESLLQTRAWGELTERRVRLPSGLQIELGFGALSWASANPVDPGTRQVLVTGFRVLLDRDGLLRSLSETLRQGEIG